MLRAADVPSSASAALYAGGWQWLRPAYSRVEKARMMDAALLNVHQAELADDGTEFAIL